MKAIQITEPYKIGLADIAKPLVSKGEALIRIVSAGICGSDVGAYRGGNNLVNYPLIIGHELAGIIESVPDNPFGFREGDRVILDPYLSCGYCYPCRIGRTNCCVNLKVLGVQTDGGMSEYFTHPVDHIIKIPDEMTWEEAAMAEPLTISLHGIHRGRLKSGETCAVIGAGPIGLVATLVAQAYGAKGILIDIVQERLDFASSLGVNHTINSSKDDVVEKVSELTNGEMANLVMECSGSNAAIRSTFDLVSYAGRITFTGWPKKETSLPTDIITKKELDVLGARTSVKEFEEAIDLILSRKVDMNTIHTHTVSLEEVPGIIKDMHLNPSKYLKVIALLN